MVSVGVGAVRVRRPVLHQHTCYVRPRLLLAQLVENANLISNLPLSLHKPSKNPSHGFPPCSPRWAAPHAVRGTHVGVSEHRRDPSAYVLVRLLQLLLALLAAQVHELASRALERCGLSAPVAGVRVLLHGLGFDDGVAHVVNVPNNRYSQHARRESFSGPALFLALEVRRPASGV